LKIKKKRKKLNALLKVCRFFNSKLETKCNGCDGFIFWNNDCVFSKTFFHNKSTQRQVFLQDKIRF